MPYLSDISVKENFRSLGEGNGMNVLKGKWFVLLNYWGTISTKASQVQIEKEEVTLWVVLEQFAANWSSLSVGSNIGLTSQFWGFAHIWSPASQVSQCWAVAYGLCEDDGETESHLVRGSQALPDFFLNPTSCSMKEILLSVSPDSRVPQSQVFFGSLGCDPGPHRDSLLPRVMLCVLFKPEFILYLSHF